MALYLIGKHSIIGLHTQPYGIKKSCVCGLFFFYFLQILENFIEYILVHSSQLPLPLVCVPFLK